MRIPTLFSLSLPAALLLALSACSDNGSAEKVGQKIDKAADSAKEKLADATDAARREAKQAGATFDDVALASKVKAEIGKDSVLKTSNIAVNSQNGVVVLSGMVEKSEDALRAVQIARGVEDVKAVENKLSVRSSS